MLNTGTVQFDPAQVERADLTLIELEDMSLLDLQGVAAVLAAGVGGAMAISVLRRMPMGDWCLHHGRGLLRCRDGLCEWTGKATAVLAEVERLLRPTAWGTAAAPAQLAAE